MDSNCSGSWLARRNNERMFHKQSHERSGVQEITSMSGAPQICILA
jgi:hypothetical protein